MKRRNFYKFVFDTLYFDSKPPFPSSFFPFHLIQSNSFSWKDVHPLGDGGRQGRPTKLSPCPNLSCSRFRLLYLLPVLSMTLSRVVGGETRNRVHWLLQLLQFQYSSLGRYLWNGSDPLGGNTLVPRGTYNIGSVYSAGSGCMFNNTVTRGPFETPRLESW